jgi:hypothetical protein
MNQSFCGKMDCFSTESDLVGDDSTVCTDDGEMFDTWVTMLRCVLELSGGSVAMFDNTLTVFAVYALGIDVLATRTTGFVVDCVRSTAADLILVFVGMGRALT